MKCLSINFKTAPENIRNKFAFSSDEKESFLGCLSEFSPEIKCIILSTCNRVEIYVESKSGIFTEIENLLAQKSGLDISNVRKFARYYDEKKAIEHLFRVACGLDSMIIGENEILAQVKNAYYEALEKNLTGYELNTIFLAALACAKKIKTQTDISKSAISYATLACNEIKAFISEYDIISPKILIIGASGKIGSSIIKNLLNKNIQLRIYATKRSHGISFDYIDNIKVIDYKNRFEYLKKVDIIISATSSPHYTINYSDTKFNINKPKLFIDLASPYDIDREIRTIKECELITIDDFENIVKNNNQKKEKAVYDANCIIEQELEKIYKTLIFHNSLEAIKNSEFSNFSLERFIYYLKDRLDSDSFQKVINTIEPKESLVK